MENAQPSNSQKSQKLHHLMHTASCRLLASVFWSMQLAYAYIGCVCLWLAELKIGTAYKHRLPCAMFRQILKEQQEIHTCTVLYITKGYNGQGQITSRCWYWRCYMLTRESEVRLTQPDFTRYIYIEQMKFSILWYYLSIWVYDKMSVEQFICTWALKWGEKNLLWCDMWTH